MESPESLMPPRSLVEKWKADAYREHGCAFSAYDYVIEEAAKWGYRQAIEQIRQKLSTFDDEPND